jgi:hypothetical protein
MSMEPPVDWLLAADEPWTRYRALVDLLGRSEEEVAVRAARAEMVAHPQVQRLIREVGSWPGYALKRHNDANHPLHKLATLADFGLGADDAELAPGLEAVLAHQSPEGAFQSPLQIPTHFGGTGEDTWSWMACDAPVLVYALLAMGCGDDPRVERASGHLAGLVDDNGWRCVVSPELGRFRGPGRKADPCPIATLYALKALARIPDLIDGEASRTGAQMLLAHWEEQAKRKYYLFGIGTDFRKLKYPFVWYDLLHVMDVLSRFPQVHTERRFQQMLAALTSQAGDDGRYTASSMYRAWKGWSFADKREPSPWLTFLVWRILKRVEGG